MCSINELILYRDFTGNRIFFNLAWLIEHHSDSDLHKDDAIARYCGSLQELVELAESHGFSGSLWHTFLAYLLVNNENAYSRACEIRGEADGTVSRIALHDFAILKSLFDFDFSVLEQSIGITGAAFLTDYQAASGQDRKSVV